MSLFGSDKLRGFFTKQQSIWAQRIAHEICCLFLRLHFILAWKHLCLGLPQEEEVQEDAKEIQQGKPYHWRDWSIIRGRDCLYIWSDAAALELSNGSNGWFRFILDGKLATMYSSGSPEGGSDSSGIWLDADSGMIIFDVEDKSQNISEESEGFFSVWRRMWVFNEWPQKMRFTLKFNSGQLLIHF